MTKAQLDWTCNLTCLFLSLYFSSVFLLLDKTPQWFFLPYGVETPGSLKCLEVPLLAWLPLCKPHSHYVLTNPLCFNWIHMGFPEHAIHTHFFLPQILFPSFPPGSSFKTCWFMIALWSRWYYLPIFQMGVLKLRKLTFPKSWSNSSIGN